MNKPFRNLSHVRLVPRIVDPPEPQPEVAPVWLTWGGADVYDQDAEESNPAS